MLTSLPPDWPFHNFRASRSGDREFYEVHESCTTDFEAPKLRKIRSDWSKISVLTVVLIFGVRYSSLFHKFLIRLVYGRLEVQKHN